MARPLGSVAGVPSLVIVEIDGAPYVDVDWLELRIYRDRSRVQIWQQEARSVARRTDRVGIALHAAYLWHALQASYRLEKWRRCLAVTQAAIVSRQHTVRVEFGLLVQDRRVAAGLSRQELADCAGLDKKTILNVEKASFAPSERALRAIVAMPDLFLTWADVNQALLEIRPDDGRKHRKPRKKKTKRRRKNRLKK